MINTKRKYNLFYLVLRSISQYIRAAKMWAILEQGFTVLSSLSLLVGVLATQRLFDCISAVSSKESSYQQVVMALCFVAVVMICQQIFRGLSYYLLGYNSYKNVGIFMSELMLKLDRISAVHFDDSEFLDKLDQAKRCIEYEDYGYFSSNCLRMVTYYGVFFVTFTFYFFKLSPILPIIIVVSFIPAIFGQLFQVKYFIELEDTCAPLRRKLSYYQDAIISQETFKETRLLGAFNYFYHLFKDTLAILTSKAWDVEKKVTVLRLSLRMISLMGLGLSALILFNATMNNDITIGTFIAIFAALSEIFSIADELVSVYVSEASETLGKIAVYFKFLDMDEEDGTMNVVDFSKGIVANNISFSYLGETKKAIQDVSLTLSENESIAIVGENGAGKTTLVRLLIGLYQPDEGTIEIGGLDSRTTHPSSIFSQISGVFQQFMRYKMTLSENISISQPREEVNYHQIQEVLSAAHVSDNDLSLDTMLTTEFGGVDLSGGQWQRIAIARGLYRMNNLIVLDEPTAAIDPIEEERVFTQFKNLSSDKTTIYVTHRLASAKFADRIIVMDKGQIIDVGSHFELLSRNGKYTEMWQAQAEWYIRD
ncbi:ABC transporter ATP-binding protein [Tuanshanicoccus lijuaniae]|uniref:ABC transporter ATP-binding protein n=1 Tax=Aerococcaceae bacterium zg-1292 TaxID=2774330 RepID=UPI001934F61C|nr:ABC transporter ATP-binding protein [Aerococcaceae bacterium zg-1292]QQA37821.1 ABC transporter ATP-binding protein [Aerococcaceae bacterium zg-1292]